MGRISGVVCSGALEPAGILLEQKVSFCYPRIPASWVEIFGSFKIKYDEKHQCVEYKI